MRGWWSWPGSATRASWSTGSRRCWGCRHDRVWICVETRWSSYLRSKELLLVLDNCEHLLARWSSWSARSRSGARGWWCSRRAARVWALPVNASWPCHRSGCHVPMTATRSSSSDAARLLGRAGDGGEVGLRGDRRQRGCGRRSGAAPRRDPVGVGVGCGPDPGVEPGAARATPRSAVPSARRAASGARSNAMRRCAPRSTGPTTCSPPTNSVMLARLSVFVGGCSLEAAEAVCSGAGIDEVEVLDLLSVLVARFAGGRGRCRLRGAPLPALGNDPPVRRRTARRRRAARAARPPRRLLRRLRGDRRRRVARPGPAALAPGGRTRSWRTFRAALAWAVAHDEAARAARFLCVVDSFVPSPLARVMLPRRRSDTRAAGHRDHRALPVRTGCGRCRCRCSTACSTEPSSSASKHSTLRESRTTNCARMILRVRGNIAVRNEATSTAPSRCSPKAASCCPAGRRSVHDFLLPVRGLDLPELHRRRHASRRRRGGKRLLSARSTGNPGRSAKLLGVSPPASPRPNRSRVGSTSPRASRSTTRSVAWWSTRTR